MREAIDELVIGVFGVSVSDLLDPCGELLAANSRFPQGPGDFGPNGLELIPLKKVGDKFVRIYRITTITPSVGSIDVTGGPRLHTTYAGADATRLGEGVRAVAGGRPVAVLMDTKGGSDIIECEGRDFQCTVKAGPGNDRIEVANGIREVVDSGPGRDTVIADGNDVVRNAEVVTRR